MSNIKYKSLDLNPDSNRPCIKIFWIVFSCAFVIIITGSFIFLKSGQGDPSSEGRYYSTMKGGIFEINESTSSYSKDDIIPKRPVILLPQPKDTSLLKLVCYYALPSPDVIPSLEPEQIEDLCTHINIAFAGIDPHNFSLQLSPSELIVVKRVNSLKKNNKNLKVLISLGGAGPSNFHLMIVNHFQRKLFIHSLITFLKQYGLDGVDIDWEWPVISEGGSPKEKVQFVQLLYEIRQELNLHVKDYILSAAVAAVSGIIDAAYYVQHMSEYVDYVNIMAYDYHYYTSYYPVTDYNSPLYPSAKDKDLLRTLNVNFSVSYWIQQGMPKEKIVLGLPVYGHSYKLFNWLNHDLHAPASGVGTIGDKGFIVYPETCKFLSQLTTSKVMDNQTKVPYAYDLSNWVSYENEDSLTAKAEFILQHNLAGAMTWSLNSDDFTGQCTSDKVTFPLHKRIRSVLFN